MVTSPPPVPDPPTVSVTPCWNDVSIVPEALTASILNTTLLPATALEVTLSKINLIAPGPTGTGLIVKIKLPEVPPPGAGFVTLMLDVPTVAISAAVTSAVTSPADTNVVTSPDPFQFTVELLTKFVPSTVSVKPAFPAKVEVGLMEVMVGAGFTVAVTLKFKLPEVPPPGAGFVTVTG